MVGGDRLEIDLMTDGPKNFERQKQRLREKKENGKIKIDI